MKSDDIIWLIIVITIAINIILNNYYDHSEKVMQYKLIELNCTEGK